MEIEFARNNAEEVIVFLQKNLEVNNDSLIPREFLCPSGINAAIKRKELIVGTINNKIVSALRFYLRKREKTQRNNE